MDKRFKCTFHSFRGGLQCRVRGGVNPSQGRREEGIDGFLDWGAAKPPVAQRAGGIYVGTAWKVSFWDQSRVIPVSI